MSEAAAVKKIEDFPIGQLALVTMGRSGRRVISVDRDDFVIGKKESAVDCVIPFDKKISRIHCRIVRRDDGYYIEDMGSTNGTFLNGVRLARGREVPVTMGDKLRLADVVFKVESAGDAMSETRASLKKSRITPVVATGKRAGKVGVVFEDAASGQSEELEMPADTTPGELVPALGEIFDLDDDGEVIPGGSDVYDWAGDAMREKYFPASSTYPMFVRSTRVYSGYDTEPIKVMDPPAEVARPEQNIVMSLLPSLAMLALVVILRGILSTTGGTFVLFSICSMGLGVVTSTVSIVHSRKKYKRDVAKREDTYRAYIEKKKKEIEDARDRELSALKKQYYSTEEDMRHIWEFSPCLFDRTPEDGDFLDAYLGVGQVAAKKRVDYRIQEKLEPGDELWGMPMQLAEDYKNIEDAPVVLPLKDANVVGVVGDADGQYDLFKVILTDLVSRQYFGDLRLWVLIDGQQEKYDWLRYLPHLRGETRRNIVCDGESRNAVFEELYRELNARSESKGLAGYNVILVMDEHGIKSHPISRFIENASELDTAFVFFGSERSRLPLYCRWIIEKKPGEVRKACLYETKDGANRREFSYTIPSDTRMGELARILSPVYCEGISLESSLTKNLSMYELMGINAAEDLDLDERWRRAKIYETMAVPIGVNGRGERVCLDIHEKYHGPHGLVAGTTGSGKSEVLQTFILGAATLFHPYEIGFVIIDFKGGGMVNQFKGLPHLVGAITNIDGKAIDRSLKSIRAELIKRQEFFAEAGVNHIDKYIKAYREGKVETALSHLVIIVDEFAELKSEQPEFMKELISTARIGRSLGVHLILATQKPAGQVNDQIWSNSKFKICLKVQTKEDSNEVLKSPLAAEIKEPGRAYLQVGNNEIFELFQSGFSGAPAKMGDGIARAFEVSTVDFKGVRRVVYAKKLPKGPASATQLEELVAYIGEYCDEEGIEPLPEICLPELSEAIPYDGKKYGMAKDVCMSAAIGIYDDPDHQYQGVAKVELGVANTVAIGASQYGKTNFLELLIRSLAETYSPGEVNIYIMDFASMVLKNFEGLAHVGGVVCPADDEKTKNLFKFLGDQINLRRERLLKVGVSSFSSYREAGYDDLPQIVLLIDNLTALKDLYLQDNDVLLNLCREGISVGIAVVITNAATSGLGYKYMSGFSTRIAFFCNESGEYATLFGSGRMQPDELPGRCLVEVEKTLYECQSFLAFEGEREIERVRRMREFVDEINARYPNVRAVPIPEIPELFGEGYVYDHFPDRQSGSSRVLGLSYATVSPLVTDISRVNMLAVSGAEGMGQSNFIRYFIHGMRGVKTEAFIFDDYKRKLECLKSEENGGMEISYYLDAESCAEVVLRMEMRLKDRYQRMVGGGNPGDGLLLLVINNEDAYEHLSGDKIAMAAFKNIIGRYRMLGAYVICGAVPNAAIAFGSPEMYRLIKESRNILFFDDIERLKLLDIPLATVRSNRKSVKAGDAFFISGNECVRVRTPLAAGTPLHK